MPPHFFREHRLAFLHAPSPSPAENAMAMAERRQVTSGTHMALEGLKESIIHGGLVAANLALVGGLIYSGIYMIVAGKQPPWMRRITGAKS